MSSTTTGMRCVRTRPVRRIPRGTPGSVTAESPVATSASTSTGCAGIDSGSRARIGTSPRGAPAAVARRADARRAAVPRSATSESSSRTNAYVDRTRRSNGSCEYASLSTDSRPRRPT